MCIRDRRYLVPKQIGEAGLTANEIVVGRDVLRRVVSEYTRESGLRELERLIATLARKVARRVVEQAAHAATAASAADGPVKPRGPVIGADEVPTFLGPPRFIDDELHTAAEVGT